MAIVSTSDGLLGSVCYLTTFVDSVDNTPLFLEIFIIVMLLIYLSCFCFCAVARKIRLLIF
jgi:hypothetical protein